MGSLRASDTAIINDLRDGFARVENRLDQIYNHIDGFIKLHVQQPQSASVVAR